MEISKLQNKINNQKYFQNPQKIFLFLFFFHLCIISKFKKQQSPTVILEFK